MTGIIGPSLFHILDGCVCLIDPDNAKCKVDTSEFTVQNAITGNKSFGAYGPIDDNDNYPYGTNIVTKTSLTNSFFPTLVDAYDSDYYFGRNQDNPLTGLEEPNKVKLFNLGTWTSGEFEYARKSLLINDNLCGTSLYSAFTLSFWWARSAAGNTDRSNDNPSVPSGSWLFGNALAKINVGGTDYTRQTLQCMVNVTGGDYPDYSGAHIVLYSYDEYTGNTHCKAWLLGDWYESFVVDINDAARKVANPAGFYNAFNHYFFHRAYRGDIDFYFNGEFVEPLEISQSNLTDWGIPGNLITDNDTSTWGAPHRNFRIGQGYSTHIDQGINRMSGGLLGHLAIWNVDVPGAGAREIFDIYHSQVRRYKSGYQGVFDSVGSVDLSTDYNNPNYYRFIGSGPYTATEGGSISVPFLKGDDSAGISITWSLDSFNNTESQNTFTTTSGTASISAGSKTGSIIVPLTNDDIINTSAGRTCSIKLSASSTSSTSGQTYNRGFPFITTLSADDNEFNIYDIFSGTFHLNPINRILTKFESDRVRTYKLYSNGEYDTLSSKLWPTYSVAWSSNDIVRLGPGAHTTISNTSTSTKFSWVRSERATVTDNFYYYAYPGAFLVTVSSTGSITFNYSHSTTYRIAGLYYAAQYDNVATYGRGYQFQNDGYYDDYHPWIHWQVNHGQSWVSNVRKYYSRSSSDNAWNSITDNSSFSQEKNTIFVSG